MELSGNFKKIFSICRCLNSRMWNLQIQRVNSKFLGSNKNKYTHHDLLVFFLSKNGAPCKSSWFISEVKELHKRFSSRPASFFAMQQKYGKSYFPFHKQNMKKPRTKGFRPHKVDYFHRFFLVILLLSTMSNTMTEVLLVPLP